MWKVLESRWKYLSSTPLAWQIAPIPQTEVSGIFALQHWFLSGKTAKVTKTVIVCKSCSKRDIITAEHDFTMYYRKNNVQIGISALNHHLEFCYELCYEIHNKVHNKIHYTSIGWFRMDKSVFNSILFLFWSVWRARHKCSTWRATLNEAHKGVSDSTQNYIICNDHWSSSNLVFAILSLPPWLYDTIVVPALLVITTIHWIS